DPARQHDLRQHLAQPGAVGVGRLDLHHGLRLYQRVDLAAGGIADVAVDAVLRHFGAELPLRVLDLGELRLEERAHLRIELAPRGARRGAPGPCWRWAAAHWRPCAPGRSPG